MGAEVEFNNMESSTNVSPIPIHRLHIDHPKDQILRDPKSSVQTRGMAKKSSVAHAFMEPKKVAQALDDEIWVKTMQEELLIEAIRIFLAFASFMGFIVYQMDVKSAFLYGIIDEEVYVSQPPGFIDPRFLNKVYKVEKALYGLHQAPRAWFQVTPKLSYLYVVKRIFIYLKGHEFEVLPMEHDILSFIRDLGHSRDIIYLTDVSVDYLHQRWEPFLPSSTSAYVAKKLEWTRFTCPVLKFFGQKPVQATKGTRQKTKAKVAKSDKKNQPTKMPKAKGLDVLSKVALTEAEQLKLATKKSKTQFYISEASGLGDGTNFESRVPDKQHLKTTDEGTNKSDGNDDDDGGIDYHDDDSDDERMESDRDEIHDPNMTNVDQTEHEEDVDERVHTPSKYELSNDEKIYDEENIDDEERIDEEEDDEVTMELYKDVNVNLGNEDTKMTNVDQGGLGHQNVSQESRFEQEKEDAHVTLTLVLDTLKADEPVQSSSISSDFTSKLLNLENPSPTDNEIASLMETLARYTTAVPKITSSFTTTNPPPPPFFNPLLQQATPTPTPTTFEATTSFPPLSNFSSVFSAATKDANAAKPTVFDDEEVTMTMAQTLIKMKAEIAKLLDEQIATRLHDEEVEQPTTREKQANDDLERAQVLQQQYDDKEENIDWNVIAEQIQEKHLDNIRKYQRLKKKPVSIAQAKNNMIIYLKNMVGYKMEHFREEPQKKRVIEETLLKESFKKLKAVEVSGSESTQETPTNDPKEMSEEDV
nr:putative ribonuclease H-like domain-containing protein [Tanacetum cinerariifolium]